MKKSIIIIIATILIVIVGVLLYKNCTKKDYRDIEISIISYSYGGGYGTIIDAATKTITINSNGEVELSNDYNSYTEKFNIDENKYNELKDFIIERYSLFDEKVKENNDVMDGGSSHIKIELKTGETKEIGGYMVSNNKYKEIKNKIIEIIGNVKLDQYLNKLKEEDTIN